MPLASVAALRSNDAAAAFFNGIGRKADVGMLALEPFGLPEGCFLIATHPPESNRVDRRDNKLPVGRDLAGEIDLNDARLAPSPAQGSFHRWHGGHCSDADTPPLAISRYQRQAMWGGI